MVRCAGCGGSNVDYEGYCWTCERQNQAGGPPPPVLPPEAEPLPQRRSLGPRIGMSVAGVAATVLGVLVGAVVLGAFRSNAGMVAAQIEAAPLATGVTGTGAPGDAAGSAAQAAASSAPAPVPVAACVTGGWRIAVVHEDLQVAGAGQIHFSGTGGSLTFRDDGTGTWDTAGTNETATVSGRGYTVTAAGKVGFRYRIYGTRIQYTDVTSGATYTLKADGARIGGGPLTAVGADANRLACDGGTMTLAGDAVNLTLTRIT